MTRTMTRNHDHFRRAIKRLPLGVASNFRYWGEDRTIYVKQGRGARIVDLVINSRSLLGSAAVQFRQFTPDFSLSFR